MVLDLGGGGLMAAVARRKRRKLARSRHAPPLPLPWCQIQKVVVERGGSGDSLASKTHRGCTGPHPDIARRMTGIT